MSTYPTLKTGATAQYPATKTITYSSFVIRFLDGSDQRYRNYSSPLNKWLLPYAQLDDTEAAAMEQFFIQEQGQAGSFSFTDPWTQAQYGNCSLDQSSVGTQFKQEAQGATVMLVAENRQ